MLETLLHKVNPSFHKVFKTPTSSILLKVNTQNVLHDEVLGTHPLHVLCGKADSTEVANLCK